MSKLQKDIEELKQRHASTTAKMMEHRRKLADLSHRILKVIAESEKRSCWSEHFRCEFRWKFLQIVLQHISHSIISDLLFILCLSFSYYNVTSTVESLVFTIALRN